MRAACGYICRHRGWHGTWRPSRRALWKSRACTMNVDIKMFGSSAVNSCPGSPGPVLAVQVALLYTVIAGRADCRARVRTATRKSSRLNGKKVTSTDDFGQVRRRFRSEQAVLNPPQEPMGSPLHFSIIDNQSKLY